jgi:putative Mg2+ transporter-C (MgtC) family protein
VTANTVSSVQKNAALEQIVGRLSLEPYVSAAKWRIEQAEPDA